MYSGINLPKIMLVHHFNNVKFLLFYQQKVCHKFIKGENQLFVSSILYFGICCKFVNTELAIEFKPSNLFDI